MAHSTTRKPKMGRHPGMWQSVPMGSFIQPSTKQHLASEECGGHTSSLNPSKKDMEAAKYFPPKKNDEMHHWNKNRPSRNEELGDRGSHRHQMSQTRGNSNSAQRHHNDFSKQTTHAATFPSSQNCAFLSNEDDFPSLSASAGPETLQASISSTQQNAWLANTSYSEKLKLIHHPAAHQDKIGRNSSSVTRTADNCNKKMFNQNFTKYDKKSNGENRKGHLTTYISISKGDYSNPQLHNSHRISNKYVNGGEPTFDQMNASSTPKTAREIQRGKNQSSRLNTKEIYAEDGLGMKPSFSRKTQGSFVGNSYNTSSRNIGGSNTDSTKNSNAKAEINYLSQPSKLAFKNKRPDLAEMQEKCISSEVPINREHVPNYSRTVRKTRVEVKNNAVWPSKTPSSKYSAAVQREVKHISSTELCANRENVKNMQQQQVTPAKTSKKRKNRKSKLKRNLAFQTGKIMILTPELYSRFTGNLSTSNQRTAQDFSFDLSDMEEYPELGQVNIPSTDQNKNVTKSVVMDSYTSDECEPISGNSVAETTSEVPARRSTAIYEQKDEESFAQKVVETNDSGKCERPCCIPRKREANLDSVSEEKESSPASEQKPKTRHDGSIQISFSDILSSTMVKVKNETSKSKKQSDSRIKVISSKKVKMDKNLLVTPNALDSSRPVVKRGKERERPKPKKHTALKRIILRERSEKKQRRSLLVKQDSVKNDTTSQSEDQEVILVDKEEKIESETDTADAEESLFYDLFIEEFAIESHEAETKDEFLDQTSNTSVEVKDEPLCNEASDENSSDLSPEEKKMQAIQIAIHTRHFREYCNHLLSAEIDQVTLALLGDLTRFQDRLHQKDPVKARIKRRLVYGIKEVTKHLKLKKVKCVILAPDSENIKSKGGLNDAVTEIVRISAEYHIPCVFALRRKTLGKACLKPVPVACVGVFSYDGSEANFKKLIELQAESRKSYDAVMTNLKELITEEQIQQLIEIQGNSPQSLQSLRVTILRENLLAKNSDLNLVFTPSGNVQIGHKTEE